MPTPQTVVKATLQEIQLGSGNTPSKVINDPARTVTVQFNPQTLKVNFSNQVSGGDQRGGASAQFVGQGTTKLTLELWFDVTVPLADGSTMTGDPGASAGNMNPDVRLITQQVAYFIKPKGQDPTDKKKFLPPAVRFHWGSFIFDGIMDSLNESLEYFSEQGMPLRASMQISIVSQEIVVADTNYATQPGTQPQTPVSSGESVQQKAAQDGQPDNWKSIAAANNIENPRQMDPGTLLDLNASASAGVGFMAGISADIGVSAGAGASISGGIGISAGASANVGVSIGASGSASTGATATAGTGVSVSTGFSANVAIGGSIATGGGASAAGASGSVSASATTRFGASSSFGRVVINSAASPFSNGLKAGFVGSVNASIIPN
jgi:hypothetical protein